MTNIFQRGRSTTRKSVTLTFLKNNWKTISKDFPCSAIFPSLFFRHRQWGLERIVVTGRAPLGWCMGAIIHESYVIKTIYVSRKRCPPMNYQMEWYRNCYCPGQSIAHLLVNNAGLLVKTLLPNIKVAVRWELWSFIHTNMAYQCSNIDAASGNFI